jgi:hypothetical protein
MKYYIDTEFLEGTQKEKFPIRLFRKETPNTIDLISIGIVAEDGREYYAISKDFNLEEAWNRFDLKETSPAKKYIGIFEEKEYWIRENVLKPIFYEWKNKDINFHEIKFTHKEFKKLLNKYGKTNKQIAEEVKEFVLLNKTTKGSKTFYAEHNPILDKPIEFYAYYADYDWVAFCWLFGKMVDLPKGFPMYCNDLKQELDRIQEVRFGTSLFNGKLANDIKRLPNYPKQTNEHNALADAKWNKELHEFLNEL